MAKKIKSLVGYSEDFEKSINTDISKVFNDGGILERLLSQNQDATVAEFIGVLCGCALGADDEMLLKKLSDVKSEEEIIGYLDEIFGRIWNSEDVTYFENMGFPEV